MIFKENYDIKYSIHEIKLTVGLEKCPNVNFECKFCLSRIYFYYKNKSYNFSSNLAGIAITETNKILLLTSYLANIFLSKTIYVTMCLHFEYLLLIWFVVILILLILYILKVYGNQNI